MGATYEKRSDGSLTIQVNGILLRHHANGELHVSEPLDFGLLDLAQVISVLLTYRLFMIQIDARPRQLTCNPRNCTLHLRSPFIDMAVQVINTSNSKSTVT